MGLLSQRLSRGYEIMDQPERILLKNGLIMANPQDCVVSPHFNTLLEFCEIVSVNFKEEPDAGEVIVIDCSGCLIAPGLVNGHIHGAMSLFRGIADDLPLEKWLNDYIFPAEAAFVNPEFVELGSTLACAEMALNGITTFADGYFFMERSADAAVNVGLRSVIAQGILDYPTPDCQQGLWTRRVEEFLASIQRNTMAQPALFCHSPYLCGPETFARAKEICASNGIRLFSHVAETRLEVQVINERYGKTPVQYLKDLGVLGPDFVGIHCIHLNDEDIRILGDTGARVIHCPESNMKLASGAADVVKMRAEGILMGLGTDGPASNNNLDLLEEMRSASLSAKLSTLNPESLRAQELLNMGTLEGAKVLGLDGLIGAISPGKAADIIVIDMDKPHLTPMYDPVSHLVFAANGSDVRDVIVNGALIVHNRKLLTIDLPDLLDRCRNMAAGIAEKVELQSFGV